MSTSKNSFADYFQLFLQGDQRAFTHIHLTLYKPIFNFARKIMQNKFEIESIIQDAFLFIWNHRERMKSMDHLKRYIRRRVRWDCLSYLRNGIGRTISLDLYNDISTKFTVYDPEIEGVLQETARVEEENLKLIEQAIACLPQNQKTVMELRLRGFKYKMIAERTGMSYQKISGEEKAAIKKMKSETTRLIVLIAASQKRKIISVADFEIYLTLRQIEIFRLKYEKGFTMAQISEALGITLWEALQYHFEGRQKLKKVKKPGWKGFP